MELLDADNANKLGAGEIVKGAEVVVARGRKYPKGTTGKVFWVAPEADAYDVIKVGIMTDDGEKIFINIKNLDTK